MCVCVCVYSPPERLPTSRLSRERMGVASGWEVVEEETLEPPPPERDIPPLCWEVEEETVEGAQAC